MEYAKRILWGVLTYAFLNKFNLAITTDINKLNDAEFNIIHFWQQSLHFI